MLSTDLFARTARKLMKQPVRKGVTLEAMDLESRLAPSITGLVFRDFNFNGTFDTAGTVKNAATSGTPGNVSTAVDVGVGGVTVTAIPASGPNVVATTAADGTYTLTTAPNTAYRIEFGNLPAGYVAGPHGATGAGTVSGTAVQFAADGATDVNFNVVRAADFFNDNPLIVTSLYVFGEQTTADPVIVSFNNNAGSIDQGNSANASSPLTHSLSIPASQVGATFGLGYNRPQNTIYAAAYTKRHSGWGPGGPGQIYRMNIPSAAEPSVTTSSAWLNLEGLTVTNATTGGTFTASVLGGFGAYATARQAAGYDYDTDGGDTGWDAVGKMGLGGLDVADDGSAVYVMNLGDRRLYVIPVNANGTPNTAGIKAYDLPTVAGATGQANIRPFAVEYHEGRVFVGMVDTAETSNTLGTTNRIGADGDRSLLRGYVYRLDPAVNGAAAYSANSVLSDATGNGFRLNYERGGSYAGNDNYNPWTATYRRIRNDQGGTTARASQYPQAMISGLAFDSAGNLTVGVRDRGADGTGYQTLSDPSAAAPGAGQIRVEGVASGDILKAFIAAAGATGTSTWRLEQNAANPTNAAQVGTGPGNNQGPLTDPAAAFSKTTNPGGEYYGLDSFGTVGAGGGHHGTSAGGVAQAPGFPDAVNTHFDPVPGGVVRSGGVRWFDSSAGTLEKNYQLYGTTNAGDITFGKANGVGEIVFVQADKAPVEVGNRVFFDDNRNGIQDANEDGIAGVAVELWWAGADNAFGTADDKRIAAVVTDSTANGAGTRRRGNYYFSNAAVPAGATPGTGEAYNVEYLASDRLVVYQRDAGGNIVIDKTTGKATVIVDQANPRYQVRIPDAAGAKQQNPLGQRLLTTFQVGGGVNAVRDSDALLGTGSLSTTAVIGGAPGFTFAGLTANPIESVSQLDAGFAKPLFLGNQVFEDKNNDGVLNGTDAGIDGVSVRLYAASDLANPIQTLTTAGGGFYQFAGLQPGQYVVEIAAPAGYRSSSGTTYDPVVGPYESGLVGNPTTDSTDHGKQVSGSSLGGVIVRANTVTLYDPTSTDPVNKNFQSVLGPNDANLVQDFGLYKVYSLGNLVWRDSNNDGKLNNAEAGIDGVTVRLFAPGDLDANGGVIGGKTALFSTVTANGGFYRFDDLPTGVYVPAVETAGAPLLGLVSSTGGTSKTTAYELAAGPIPDPTADDGDDNGSLRGSFVRSGAILLGPGANEPTGETNLAAGPNPQGTVDNQANMTADFGFYLPQSLGNRVFNDLNNDGKFNGSDAGLNGVTVRLFRADVNGTPVGAALETQVTQNGGYYLFTGLGSDTYTVEIDGKTLPAGGTWFSSTGQNGSPTGGPYEPALNPNVNRNDNEDHGTVFQNDAAAYLIRSGPVVLSPATAPTGEGATPGFTDPTPDANSNLTVDFGFWQPLSLGNFIWNDVNNNGVFDSAGEAGLANVPVSLYLDNGDGVFDPVADALVGTVNTKDSGAAGFYLFPNLGAGKYFVSVAPPAGFVSSTGKNGSATGPSEPVLGLPGNNSDHGTQAGGRVVSNLVTLSPGTAPVNDGTTPSFTDPAQDNSSNLTIDFGLFQPLSVGNFVWNDVNNNGVFDPGEPGIDGVPVELLDGAGNSVATTATAGGGGYLFTNLTPGNYQVRLTPAGGLKSSTAAGYEPGVNGTEDKQDHGTQVGNAVVGGVFTLAAPGNRNNPDSAGFANLRQDFGLFTPIPPTLTLGDLVFVDANNNGVRDAGEAGLDNVPVDLLDGTGATLATTTTAGGGLYQFTGLQPGTYQVRIRPTAPYFSSTGGGTEPGVSGNQNDTDHGTQGAGFILAAPVTLAAPFDPANPDLGGLGNLRQDFGVYIPTYQLGNFVWNDANNNGVFDAGESPLGGVTVTLTKAGAVVGSTTTAADGTYLFSGLRPGDYTVTVTPGAFQATSTGKNASPTGPYEPGVAGTQNNEDHGTQTAAGISANVSILEGTNPDGTANLRQDFGVFTPISFGNTVWNDANNNGLLDAGETTVPGVTAQLVQGGTVIATAVTGADGKYIFTNLIPGTYTVQIVAPPGTVGSTPSFDPLNGVDNQNIGATTKNGIISSNPFALTLGNAPLVGGNTNPNNYVTGDFGLVPTPIASVSGYVYLDPNVDGKFTPGVNGDHAIGGVTVTLTGNGITRTTTTDSKGFYQFAGLPPGSYTITETQPGGQIFDGLDTLGSLGGTTPGNDVHTVALAAGDAGTDYNFGEIPPAGTYGYVWVDVNKNCAYDLGEPVLGGVPVTISGTAFAGTVLARPLTAADVPGGLTVLTDSTGRYNFPVLPPGSYTLGRGDLTAEQQTSFTDWCLQQGDPSGNTPGTNGNSFTGVIATSPTPIRGPFNFGVVFRGGSAITDPTKQNFLGSTPAAPPTVPEPPAAVPPTGGPTRGAVSLNPAFNTTTGTPTKSAFVVAAAGAGLAPEVRVFDYASGIEKFRFYAYEAGFTGGVRAATADVNGDGTDDIVTATGVGGGPRVRVFSGVDGSLLQEFFAYEPEFRGGVFVAAADVDGDGKADIITGTEVGGGPRVTVFSGSTGAVLQDFFAFDQAQRGGVRVAAADFNGDGRADIVATTGTGVPTRVRVFDGRDTTLLTDYAPYEATYTGGVNIAAADFNGDGTPDVIVGAETGGGPRVQVFSGLSSITLANFFAYEDTFTGGVRVAATDVDGDGKADITASPGAGGAARVRVLRSTDLSAVDDFYAFGPEYVGGLYVG